MSYILINKSIKKIGNRFDLVLIASFRARQIQIFSKNNISDINFKKNKPSIVALEEIENDFLDKNILDVFFNKY